MFYLEVPRNKVKNLKISRGVGGGGSKKYVLNPPPVCFFLFFSAPDPKFRVFFIRFWWFDLVHLMILDKMSPFVKIEATVLNFCLDKPLELKWLRNLAPRLQIPRSMYFLEFDDLLEFNSWFWINWSSVSEIWS